MTFRIGFPTLPPLTDPNFSGALQRDIDDLSKGVGTALQAQAAWTEIGVGSAPAFQNSWVNYGGGYPVAGYYKDSSGRVWLGGLIKSGTVGAAAFTLPVGFRPLSQRTFSTPSNHAFGQTDVFANGGVYIEDGSNVYVVLDGISFRAEQ